MTKAFDELDTQRRASLRQELAAECRLHGWTCASIGGIFCLAGGIVAAILGSVLTAITWVTGVDGSHGLFLHRFGTVLLFLTIPLIAVGAHCLDIQEAASKPKLKA
ncbi:MAG TPA: hypothetical protein VK619_12165 [Pyrinomonadaceae bacterium]|nr:hypothetical protein [Pyrinomonadaceae bacterium]